MDLDKYRTPPPTGPRCLIGLLYDRLDTDRANLLRTILNDPDIPRSRIDEHSEADFGVRIPYYTASRHSRGRCSCG